MLVVQPRTRRSVLALCSLSGQIQQVWPYSLSNLRAVPASSVSFSALTVTHGEESAVAAALAHLRTLAVPVVPLHYLETRFCGYCEYPFAALVANGSDTLVVLVRALGDYQIVAVNLDASLGMATGKLAREFGLQPSDLEPLAACASEDRIHIPTPMVSSLSCDFSFQGPWRRALQYIFPRSTDLHPLSPLLEPHFLRNSPQHAASLFRYFYEAQGKHLRIQLGKSLQRIENCKLSAVVFCGGSTKSLCFRREVQQTCDEAGLKLIVAERKEEEEMATTALSYHQTRKFTDIRQEDIPIIPNYPLGGFLPV